MRTKRKPFRPKKVKWNLSQIRNDPQALADFLGVTEFRRKVVHAWGRSITYQTVPIEGWAEDWWRDYHRSNHAHEYRKISHQQFLVQCLRAIGISCRSQEQLPEAIRAYAVRMNSIPGYSVELADPNRCGIAIP